VTEPIPGLRARRALLGPQLEPADHVWLTFDRGIISGIGTGRPPLPLPEAPGAVLVPGLVDCHVHLAMSGSADVVRELAALDHDGLEDAVRRNAAAQVHSGVTTVRDLGSPDDVAVSLERELGALGAEAPTVVGASAISSPSGHGHFLAQHASTPSEYAEAVEAAASAGARGIKVFATGGVITEGTRPGAPQMSQEELAAVVLAARAHGLDVAAHAHGAEGIRRALLAGVHSIEHFSHLDDRDVSAVLQSTTWLVSTLVATERFVRDPRRGEATPETLSKILAHVPFERESLRRAVTTGCRLAAGTDAGTTFNPHGGGMFEEAELLADAGLHPAQVLRTLTVQGALLLGEPAGCLAVGRRADAVCLEGDPTTDPRCLRNVRAVIVRGHRLPARPSGHR
jgi:imidazolonepropionase-like amidohydrolase